MIRCIVTVALLSSAACLAQVDCNDGSCCSTYIEINDPRRSIKAIWEPGQDPICDRGLGWGWYRFTSFAGGKMPENKISPNRCGTQAPIWLDGAHPTAIGENVVRRACVNVLDLSNGCFTSFDINITKCADDVFVYYLRPPWYCAVGYCAGRFDSFRWANPKQYPEASLKKSVIQIDRRIDQHERLLLWVKNRSGSRDVSLSKSDVFFLKSVLFVTIDYYRLFTTEQTTN